MKNIILTFLAFVLFAAMTSVSAQEMAAKAEASATTTKKANKTPKKTLLKNIEDEILEINEDERGVALITAERDFDGLKKSYMNSKFGKPLAEMNKEERKENVQILKNDDEFINLRKQTDIAKIEKEEYLIGVNAEYAKIMADIEEVKQNASKNSSKFGAKMGSKNGKNGLGAKMGKGKKMKKGAKQGGISRKSLKK